MIETKNTLKVINMLRKYTDKKVFVKDIKELSNDLVFFWCSILFRSYI